MKQILTFFVIALLVSSCQSTNPQGDLSLHNARDVQRGDSNSLQKALVIGNSDYEYLPLKNSIPDAKNMASTLEQLGFEVTLKTDLNYQAMKETLREFSKRLSTSQNVENVGLFYFLGYGSQWKGQNFLIPTSDGNIQVGKDLEQNAVHVKNILAMMGEANNGINLLILDVYPCRENPLGIDRNFNFGWKRMQPPKGALIAFAHTIKKTLCDGEQSDGLYTKHLLNVLKTAKHRRIEDVFMDVHNSVIDESGGTQKPWYHASLRKPFCFGGCQ